MSTIKMNLTKNPQISSAIKKITDAGEILHKQIISKVEDAVNEFDETVAKVQEQEAKLANLKEDYIEKLQAEKVSFSEAYRVMKYDLGMQVKEEKLSTAKVLVAEFGNAWISNEEVENLQKKLDKAKDHETNAVKAGISAATRNLEFKHKQDTMEKEMKISEQQYEISALKDQLASMQARLRDSQDMAKQLQGTITSVAEAGKSNVNVNGK